MGDVVVTGSTDQWEARVDAVPIGALRAWTRPDGRCFLLFRECGAEAYGPLVAAAMGSLNRDLYTVCDDSDSARLRCLIGIGFTVQQRENRFEVSCDPQRYGLRQVRPPPGIEIISAADADVDRLRELDDALRQDIPGTDGWRWEPADFADETFADPAFDPETYVVAVQADTGAYVGLLRVWMNPAGPRLGCLGVLSAHRRIRVTPALVASVATVLHERGYSAVVTEIATSNRAASALVARREVRHLGTASHLVLRHG
jgi:ribosomal protein S18 acetylase RimI-like enzyme